MPTTGRLRWVAAHRTLEVGAPEAEDAPVGGHLPVPRGRIGERFGHRQRATRQVLVQAADQARSGPWARSNGEDRDLPGARRRLETEEGPGGHRPGGPGQGGDEVLEVLLHIQVAPGSEAVGHLGAGDLQQGGLRLTVGWRDQLGQRSRDGRPPASESVEKKARTLDVAGSYSPAMTHHCVDTQEMESTVGSTSFGGGAGVGAGSSPLSTSGRAVHTPPDKVSVNSCMCEWTSSYSPAATHDPVCAHETALSHW